MADLPSPDLVREQAYQISRGVRPMALLGTCSHELVVEVRGRLEVGGQHHPEAMPFVLSDGDAVHFGYSAAAWCVDLYRWAQGQPLEQRERIEGLLLGYGPREIERHDEARRARRCGHGQPLPDGARDRARPGAVVVAVGRPRANVVARRGRGGGGDRVLAGRVVATPAGVVGAQAPRARRLHDPFSDPRARGMGALVVRRH